MRHEICRGALACSVLAVASCGCATHTYPPPPATAVAAPPPAAQPARTPGFRRFVLAYPTGYRETSTVLVEKLVPTQVRVGAPYEYRIVVTNLTAQPLFHVVIDERATGLEIAPARAARPGITSPEPGRWVIGRLAPGKAATIDVRAIARSVGTRSSCLTVDYKPGLCSTVAVVNPELALTRRAPRVAYACEQPAFVYAVTNTGTGVAHNVVIIEHLPEGMVTATGESTVRLDVGDLPAGQTVQRSVAIRATRPGTYGLQALAHSQSAETTSERAQIAFVQPQLGISVVGPEWQYAGQPITYAVTVTNTSDVPARDTRVMLDAGGQLATGRERSLGTIAPHQAKTIDVTVRGTGEQVGLAATAQSACAPEVADRAVTDVRRLAALRVETVDTRDPIQVGETTGYRIAVTNQGQAAIDGVGVVAQIPDGMTLINVQGPTEPRLQGRRLELGPVSIPAGATASWLVEVRADRPGTMRFRTEVDSPFLDRPVPDVEPTRVFQPPQQPQPPGQPPQAPEQQQPPPPVQPQPPPPPPSPVQPQPPQPSPVQPQPPPPPPPLVQPQSPPPPEQQP